MLATKHDHFSPRLRNRLKTTSMGLGLVRLLLDAGRAEVARTTLLSLQNGFQVPEISIEVHACDRDDEFAIQAQSASSQSGLAPILPVIPPTQFPIALFADY